MELVDIGPKISIIGAGSLFWSSNLVHDLCLTPDLEGSAVSLMDINEERLRTIVNFARRYSSERKFNIKFEATTDRKESVKDADLVINVAMAGGHDYYERMRKISEFHGYYRGINSVEWNMVSDYHTIWGYYQFKLALEIARDVESLSPDSWFLQLSNPVFELATLLGRETRLKIIGICHGHQDSREVANAMGFDEREMETESIGLNHTIWLTGFKRNGVDKYPELREWIDSKYEGFYKDWSVLASTIPFLSQMSPVMVDMYNKFGLVPIGDTVRSGMWKYHRNIQTKKKWYGGMGGFDSRLGWNYYLKKEKSILEDVRNSLRDTITPLSNSYSSEISDEPVVPIMDSLLNNKRIVHQVNVINNGFLGQLPRNVAVETPAYVDGKGVHQITEKKLPARIVNFSLLPRILRMEWAIEAFLEDGSQVLEMWLNADPRTRNSKQVESVMDALLGLPENEEMARHFR